MSASAGAPSGGSPERTEPRERVVHLVEYSRFPRRERGDARRIAYTQDRSDSGLGLDLPEPVSPGELLQVSLRDIDGLHSVDGLARVVWCRVVSGGRARADGRRERGGGADDSAAVDRWNDRRSVDHPGVGVYRVGA